MKKLLIFGVVFIGSVFLQNVNAQNSCKKVHNYCTASLPDEEISRKWIFDNQSKSATFEKGETYEMSFIAYKDHVYRISTCTDMVDDSKVNFEVLQIKTMRKQLTPGGEYRTVREKVAFYNNKEDGLKSFHKFKVRKTVKIYVRVNIPTSGESATKKFKDSDNVCVGVLLQHKKLDKVGF